MNNFKRFLPFASRAVLRYTPLPLPGKTTCRARGSARRRRKRESERVLYAVKINFGPNERRGQCVLQRSPADCSFRYFFLPSGQGCAITIYAREKERERRASSKIQNDHAIGLGFCLAMPGVLFYKFVRRIF